MRVRGLLFPASLAMVAAACSLVTDLSGFVAPLSTTPGADAAPVDATVDAGMDTGSPTVLPPRPTCPQGAFCDDFDEGLLGAMWGAVDINVGTLVLDGERFRSSPRSLHATTPAGESTRPKNALVRHALSGLPKSVRCAFSVFLHRQNASGYVDFFQLTGKGAGVDLYLLKLGIYGVDPSTRIDVHKSDKSCDCPRLSTPALKPLKVAEWVSVVYTTDFSSVTMTFDGEAVLGTSFPTGLDRTTMNIELGLQDFGTDGAEMSFDDLTCTFTY